jgi:predicted dehydrogenase
MGRVHINGFKEHPLAELTALADIDQDLLKRCGKEFGVAELYTDAYEMFEKARLDVVSIAVPNKLHKPLAIAALQSGINVLCEKPMAMNVAEAEEMLAAAQNSGKRLGINFSMRFKPQSFAMKKFIEAGELGDIYFARSVWHRRRGMPGFGGWFGRKELSGGGPLIDLGVHRLDLALWLMNYPEPEWVMGKTCSHIASAVAQKQNMNYDVEDFACCMIKFANGSMLELEASWAANIKENEQISTRLFGTRGGIYQYNLNEGYQYHTECYIEKNECQYDMHLHPPVPASKSSYYSFIDAIVKDEPFCVTPEQGVIVMRLLDAIYESAACGKPVNLQR